MRTSGTAVAAALRAAALGYTEMYWYRGGIEAWIDAGGELRPMRMYSMDR